MKTFGFAGWSGSGKTTLIEKLIPLFVRHGLIVSLIKQIKEDKASAIFVENITNPRLIEQIASETKLNVGGTLFSDALSKPDEGASTYIDMMHHNIETFKRAILGS